MLSGVRRVLVRFAAAVLLIGAACSDDEGGRSASDGDGDTIRIEPDVIDPPTQVVFAGNGDLPVPADVDLTTYAVTDDPFGIDPALVTALSDLVATTDAFQLGWRLVALTDDAALFIADPGGDPATPGVYRVARFDVRGAGWEAATVTESGVSPLLPGGDEPNVAWSIAGVANTEIELLLEPTECRSGEPLDADDLHAFSWSTPEGLAVAFVEEPPGGDVDCQSRPTSPATVTVDALGVQLVNGAVVPAVPVGVGQRAELGTIDAG